jgi:biofilm PGA synthesis lipoprotein PgaB
VARGRRGTGTPARRAPASPYVGLLALVLLWAAPTRAADHAVILQYHHVADDTPASTTTSPALFAEHLAYLADHGFGVAPVGETVHALAAGRDLPDSTVCLTFDDAWNDVADIAWPLVKARGWTMTVFVATGEVDAGGRGVMSWDRMRALAAEGVTFGPHSVHHDYQIRPVAGESAEQRRARLRDDVATSLRRLREELGDGPVVDIYVYPFGEFDRELQDAVAEAGLAGLGQHSGAAWAGGDMTALPRYPMGGPYGSLKQFGVKAASLPLPVVAASPGGMVLSGDNTRPTLDLTLQPGDYVADRLAAYVGGASAAVQWLDREAGQVRIATPEPLPRGRSRTNLTAPAARGGRWYWYSHPWLRLP